MTWQSQLSSSQRRQLIKMMLSQESPKISTYEKRKRDGLVAAGLVALDKRGRATHMSLTDRVYNGAQQLLRVELGAKGTRKDLAYHALARISGYLEATDLPVADFIRPPAAAAARGAREAYLRLSGGQWGARVRIADLRRAAAPTSRDALDGELLALLRQGQAHLLPLDDPEARTADDEANALFIAGEPRHIVYMEGSR